MIKRLIYLMIAAMMLSCAGDPTDDGDTAGETNYEKGVATPGKDTGLIDITADSVPENLEQEPPQPKLRAQNVEAYQQERLTPEFHFKRGLVLYEINKYREGIQEFDTVIELRPDMAKAYINRGKGKYELENYQSALQDFEKAAELEGNDSTAYLHLGLTHYQMGNYTESIEAYNEMLKVTENSAMAYFNRGIAYGHLKEYREAIQDFTMATEINPNYTEAWFNLGLAYFWLGDEITACDKWTIASNLGSQKAGSALSKYCYGEYE